MTLPDHTRMRVLWISCLLIGSISCVPVWKNSADTGFRRQPSNGYWFSGGGVSSDPGSSSSLPSLPYPSSDKLSGLPAPQDALSSAGPGSSSSFNMAGGNVYDGGYASFRDDTPEVSNYGAGYVASQSSGYDSGAPVGGYAGYGYDGYASSGSGNVGDASYGSNVDWNSGSATSYDAGDENQEPVFSDVSDLDPVYSFKSRSRYQQGRAVFAQTRYTPGEPAPPVMPESRPISKTSNQKSPAKAPTKGGF